jgi:hypothetical protein
MVYRGRGYLPELDLQHPPEGDLDAVYEGISYNHSSAFSIHWGRDKQTNIPVNPPVAKTILQTDAALATNPNPIKQKSSHFSPAGLWIRTMKVNGKSESTTSVTIAMTAVASTLRLTASRDRHTASGTRSHMADSGLQAEKSTALVTTAMAMGRNIMPAKKTRQRRLSGRRRKSMRAMLSFAKATAHPEACWPK